MNSAEYPPEQELLDRLERVRLLLAHALRVRQLMTRGGAGVQAAWERFLHENVEPGFVSRPPELERALAQIDAHVAGRVADRETRFTRLVRLLGLDALEIDLLLCALAPSVRRGFREALQLVGPEVVAGGVHPAAHLVEIVASSAETYGRARAAVDDDGTLIASGALLAAPMAPVSPPLWRALTPSPALYRWLLGGQSPYPVLAQEPPLRRAVDEDVEAHLQAAVREAHGQPVRVVLIGDAGAGRTRAAAALAHMLGCRAAWLPRVDRELAPAVLDARLRQRLVFLDTASGAELPPEAITALAQPELACAVAALPGSAAAAGLLAAGFTRVDLRMPSLRSQVRAWRHALGQGVPEDEIADVVRGHSLPFHAIEEAATQAKVESGVLGVELPQDPGEDPDAPPGEQPDVAQTARALLQAAERAARAITSDRLSDIADRLSTTLTWDDLVLPEDVRASVHEIWRAAAARRTVYEAWGFEARTPYGRAISAIFTGPPGTGKTMVATLIARQLNIELFRVDLSRLVDKYIGETEKHLAMLFGEAERGRCVLLFDEADAIFGKRTKGGESATERYANLEVNYLLQRIETFSGIVLLTTNQESMIDEAFKRRLRYRVDFPFPDEDERALIWRRLIPPEAPVAANFDPQALARRYELSGGHIKNAVLRAAFAAAADGAPIDQARLIRAANQELENIGKLVMH
jgi:hypothetical protein